MRIAVWTVLILVACVVGAFGFLVLYAVGFSYPLLVIKQQLTPDKTIATYQCDPGLALKIVEKAEVSPGNHIETGDDARLYTRRYLILLLGTTEITLTGREALPKTSSNVPVGAAMIETAVLDPQAIAEPASDATPPPLWDNFVLPISRIPEHTFEALARCLKERKQEIDDVLAGDEDGRHRPLGFLMLTDDDVNADPLWPARDYDANWRGSPDDKGQLFTCGNGAQISLARRDVDLLPPGRDWEHWRGTDRIGLIRLDGRVMALRRDQFGRPQPTAAPLAWEERGIDPPDCLNSKRQSLSDYLAQIPRRIRVLASRQ